MLNLRQIHENNFGLPVSRSLQLPETGVVVITGENGTGKSCLAVDGPAWAGWGELPRVYERVAGTSPRPPEAAGATSVTIDTDLVRVTRSIGPGKKSSFEWNWHGQEPQKFDTPSKAEEALEGVIGSYKLWLATHVFSSGDAGFSKMTDGDRKRFLERLVQLDLDSAAKRSAADLAALEREIADLVRYIAGLRQEYSSIEVALSATAEPGEPVDPSDIQAASTEIATLQQDKQRLANADSAARVRASETARARDRLKVSTCASCGQAIPAELAAAAAAEAEAAAAEAARIMKEAAEQLAVLDGQLEVARENRTYLTQMAAYNEALAKQDEAQAKSFDRMFAIMAEIGQLEPQVEELRHRLLVLGHAVQILGIKGYRSYMLGETISRINKLANQYLAILSPKIRVEISPTGTTAKGGITDAITLKILNAGGGQFQLASGGQKRRVDVAIMLALAALAERQGTLFLDEVMDCLDVPGVLAVCQLIKMLAATRCVVVITHNQDLAAELKRFAVSEIHLTPLAA